MDARGQLMRLAITQSSMQAIAISRSTGVQR